MKLHIPFDRNIEIRDVMEDKVDKGFVLVFSEELNERLGGQRLAELVRGEAVLSKHIVELLEN